jgi:hypothetical protein
LVRSAVGGTARIVYALAALVASFLVFAWIGEQFDYWSPALGLAALGGFSLAGWLIWKFPRYVVATVIAGGGALAGFALGSTAGLGLKIVIGAGVLTMGALLASLLEAFSYFGD